MKKGILSRSVKVFRESIKTLFAFLITRCFRSRSYPIGGIPRGLIAWEKLPIKGEKHDCYPSIKSAIAPPSTIHSQLHWKFKDGMEVSQPPMGVITVPQGIATASGGNLSPCSSLVTTFLEVADGKPLHEHPLFRLKQRSLPPKIYQLQSPVATLSHEWQGAFYHWFFQILPRLHLLEKSGFKDFHLYVENAFSFQKESLSLLGFNKDKIIPSNVYHAIKTPLLIVSSIPSSPQTWSCDFLRKAFLPYLTPKEHSRLYITREDVNKRKIANSEEVERVLKDYDFKKVSLSELPLLEQMSLFHSAKYIVAPHGAGLSHLTFCQPNTSVLEIFSPAYVNTCYFTLSSLLGIKYHLLFGEGERYPPYYNPPIDPDIVIDLKKLKLSLERLFQ